jgi:hypothetical protein
MRVLFALIALTLLSSCGIGAIGAGHCNHEQLRDPAQRPYCWNK